MNLISEGKANQDGGKNRPSIHELNKERDENIQKARIGKIYMGGESNQFREMPIPQDNSKKAPANYHVSSLKEMK